MSESSSGSESAGESGGGGGWVVFFILLLVVALGVALYLNRARLLELMNRDMDADSEKESLLPS